MEDQAPGLRGVHRQLPVLINPADAAQGGFVGVGPGELAAVGGGLVGRQVHPGGLAVFKEEQQGSGVVRPGEHGVHHALPRVHAQLGGQVVPQEAGLGVVKLTEAGLVDLTLVGEEHDLRGGGGLEALAETVALLELLLAAHPQALGSDLLEVSLPGEEEMDGVLLHLLRLVVDLDLVSVDNGGAAGLAVLPRRLVQLLHDDLFHPLGAAQNVLQVLDLVLEGGGLVDPLEDIFLVDVAEPDLRYVLRLDLVDAEADHQVGDDLGLLLRLPDDPDGLVDVQQNALEAL